MFKNILPKKSLKGIFGLMSLAVLIFGIGQTALASGNDGMMSVSFDNGREFGQHVSEHAREGHLGADMNPGMHQGYSPWANDN